jgi:hypothetical protein
VWHDPADVLMVEDDPGDALIVHLAAASCVVMTCWRECGCTCRWDPRSQRVRSVCSVQSRWFAVSRWPGRRRR